jgi:hypothetical protein
VKEYPKDYLLDNEAADDIGDPKETFLGRHPQISNLSRTREFQQWIIISRARRLLPGSASSAANATAILEQYAELRPARRLHECIRAARTADY